MRLIDLDELKEYPIRLGHYDKIHGNIHFVYGVESVLEYADYLPTVKAIPIEWIEKYIWGADTHEEKRALRKMYIAWEKENEAD